MRIRRWTAGALAATALVVTAGCSTTTGTGAGADPRAALSSDLEQVYQDRSVRFDGRYTVPGMPEPLRYSGVLSWADGTTGEITLSGTPGGTPTTARITKDALYGTIPPELGRLPGAGLAGKTWLKQSFADLEQTFGPLGAVFRAAFDQTNPIRSAGLIIQSQDLRVVGEEVRNGVPTTHYAGTVEFTKLVTDLRLGLDQATLDALRAQFPGNHTEQLDLWVDQDGRPIHAESASTDPANPARISADYRDYGTPVDTAAPPADQVIDAAQLRGSLGLPN